MCSTSLSEKVKIAGMKTRPLPIIIVATLFIIVGVAGFLYHIKDFIDPRAKLYEALLAELLGIIAIVCGILLLRANSSGRWLSIAWVLSHILISAFNSTSELIAHIVLLVAVSVLLFLPVSSIYFQNKKPVPGGK